jgi:hypothetical protein
MVAPYLKYFVHTSVQVLAQLIYPKTHDLPAHATELDIPPDVIKLPGAVRIAVITIAVHLNVKLE